ncbi:MAG: GTPase Era [Candidatus Omnitrophica bacterium]|nr:GTPase Era [Candidatus Omnitrophota bacterium]
MIPPPAPDYHSGFVGVIGKPNVGKSTIVNAFVGRKVSIVSSRPQTTRNRILGILTRPDAQVILIDTPGWHQPEHTLGRHMIAVTKGVVEDADVLLAIVDAAGRWTKEDDWVFDQVRRANRPSLLALNKVDLVNKRLLLPLMARCADLKLFEELVPVSALTGDNMDRLLAQLITRLPQGPRWYEPDQLTDQPAEQLIREFIREQVLHATRQEVPHAVAVLLDELTTKAPPAGRPQAAGLTLIRATILVEREGQKAIVIGKQGRTLKQIGTAARLELERWLGRKVFLELWVKVAKQWRADPALLRELGYEAHGGKA